MKNKKFIAYIGFSDNEPYIYDDKEYYDGVLRYDIFKLKHEAKKCYEDVRKVEIKVIG